MVPLYGGAYGKTSIGTCRGCRAGRPGKVPGNNRSVFRNEDSDPTTFFHNNCALISWASLARVNIGGSACIHTTPKNRNKFVRGRHRPVPLHPPPVKWGMWNCKTPVEKHAGYR